MKTAHTPSIMTRPHRARRSAFSRQCDRRQQISAREIDVTTKTDPKIGLGVMGWSDMLAYLGVPYNSDEAVALARRVMEFITKTGRAESAETCQSARRVSTV